MNAVTYAGIALTVEITRKWIGCWFKIGAGTIIFISITLSDYLESYECLYMKR